MSRQKRKLGVAHFIQWMLKQRPSFRLPHSAFRTESSMSVAAVPALSTAWWHDVDLRKVVKVKIVHQLVKYVTQLTRGWVIMIVDDEATRTLTHVARMSELTDCRVSILERLELKRQSFPDMNALYFIAPTAANVRRLARDFEDARKPKYKDVYLYFLYHAGADAFNELKKASPGLLQRLKALQEVNVDFLHVAKVSTEIGKSMTALSASSAGKSLGRGKSTDLHEMAVALRELPEYRERLGKLSQLLSLAKKAMEIFNATTLLDASNIEQTLATGVKASGKKLKHLKTVKQLKKLLKDPKLTENDRFRVATIFLLT